MALNKNIPEGGVSKELLVHVVRIMGVILGFIFMGYFGYITNKVLDHDKKIDSISKVDNLEKRLSCNWKYTSKNRNRIAQAHGVDPHPPRCD